MKTFKELIEQSDVSPAYHKKKMPVETPQFSGHAHFRYEKTLKGGSHEYYVTYKGKLKRSKDEEDHTSSKRMIVRHGRDGKPFEHRMDGSTSKKLSAVVKKRAPSWVSLKDLQPKE